MKRTSFASCLKTLPALEGKQTHSRVRPHVVRGQHRCPAVRRAAWLQAAFPDSFPGCVQRDKILKNKQGRCYAEGASQGVFSEKTAPFQGGSAGKSASAPPSRLRGRRSQSNAPSGLSSTGSPEGHYQEHCSVCSIYRQLVPLMREERGWNVVTQN